MVVDSKDPFQPYSAKDFQDRMGAGAGKVAVDMSVVVEKDKPAVGEDSSVVEVDRLVVEEDRLVVEEDK